MISEKGGPVFKPVAKPRPRPASTTPVSGLGTAGDSHATVSSSRPAELHTSQTTTLNLPGTGSFYSGDGGTTHIVDGGGDNAPRRDSSAMIPSSSGSHPTAMTSKSFTETTKKNGFGNDLGRSENGDVVSSQSQRQSTPSGSRKPRKPRTSSVRPFDGGANPGEELDPTMVTMAALCSDTGQGRISSKAAEIQTHHVAWKASNREKRAHLKTLVEAKKVRGRDHDDGKSTASKQSFPGPASTSAAGSMPIASGSGKDRFTEENSDRHGFDYSQALTTSRFNVQVRIGSNGETFIDEESLFVDRNDEEDTENYTHVEESDHTKFVNSGTYGRKYRGSRWGAEETELFYHVSQQSPMT
jgi:transcription factor TFIIIB component B''